MGAVARAPHEARRRDVVPACGTRGDRLPLPLQLRGMDPHRGGAAAVGRLRAAPDGGRRVGQRERVDGRVQPRRLRHALHRPRGGRLLPHAPLRPARSGDADDRGRGGKRGRARAGVLR